MGQVRAPRPRWSFRSPRAGAPHLSRARACVAYGGDVDTVAAIALAAASCSRDVTQNLPAHLADALENGAFGRDYIVALDARLLALAG
jgi:ADP-ribosyl-[dinitrogen reductase] hydrolase